MAALALIAAALSAESGQAVPLNDILLAQSANFTFDATMTIKQAMDNYSYFSRVDWREYYDANNRKVVEARGYFDMAKIASRTDSATCVNAQGAFVGLTDTTPYLILQFKTDFLKQRASLTHSGLGGLFGEAALDDTDLLWAKALVTNELPSPAPLCNMPLADLSAPDKLAIQEAPVVDPDAPAQDASAPGPPRLAPDPAPAPGPPAKSALETTKKSHENPPTPTQTGR